MMPSRLFDQLHLPSCSPLSSKLPCRGYIKSSAVSPYRALLEAALLRSMRKRAWFRRQIAEQPVRVLGPSLGGQMVDAACE